MSRVMLAAVTLALLLAGCGSSSAADEGSPLDCGRYENRNQPPTDLEETAHRCILDAFSAGEPAILSFSRATVEGDPIEHRVTVTGDEVEIVVDNREDAYGDGTVRRYRCLKLRSNDGYLQWDDCEEIS